MIPSEAAPDASPPRPPPNAAAKVVKLAQTVIVDRPCAAVFAFRSALANTPEWRRGVISASVDPPGPIWVGSRCTEIRTAPEDSTEQWELEITEYEPASALGIVARRGETQVRELHRFACEGDVTRYTVSVEVTYGSLSGSALQKQLLENLLQLKWALEGRPARNWGVRGQRG